MTPERPTFGSVGTYPDPGYKLQADYGPRQEVPAYEDPVRLNVGSLREAMESLAYGRSRGDTGEAWAGSGYSVDTDKTLIGPRLATAPFAVRNKKKNWILLGLGAALVVGVVVMVGKSR
jgi:hypothetical protein